MESLSFVLRERRKALGLTLSQVADMMGVTEATVQRWESGNIKSIRYEKIGKLAEILGVSPADLMGWEPDSRPSIPQAKNIISMPKTYTVPLVGTIACGQPILAVEEAEETVEVPNWVHADFALRCKGDSMINARIFDGDIVYIQRMPNVEPGQIAAVRVEDEATLKKVYYTPGSNRITLRACNPLYPDLVYENGSLDQIEILGLAVGFYSTVRHEM